MQVGIIGLGRMGANLALSAVGHGHEVVGHDRDADVMGELARQGVGPAESPAELVGRLARPRIVLLYLPHGAPTQAMCETLRELLAAGDVVVDGGNSHWEDTRRRHADFANRDIRFVDVGTSGGIRGARHGACFTAGGDADGYALVQPLLEDLAFDDHALLFVGEPGSGHFSKLIHNAVEFGMVQAIAEGVELLERSEFTLDLPSLFDNWAHGSVIRSWLIELMRDALQEHSDLERPATYVEDTGEVKWVLDWALARDIPGTRAPRRPSAPTRPRRPRPTRS